MAGMWQGGGSGLGGLAGGLTGGYLQGAQMLRQRQQDDRHQDAQEQAEQDNQRLNEQKQENFERQQGFYEKLYGGSQGAAPPAPPYQGMGTPQQPDMGYHPPPPPAAMDPLRPPKDEQSSGADMGGLFRSGASGFARGIHPNAFFTAVSGQEPPEDIRMDEQGGATGGYGGAAAMRPGAGTMPQNIQHTQRTARMAGYEHMQSRKNQLMPQVKTMMAALQMHDQARDWRPGERENLVAQLEPAAQELHQLGGTAQQPEGAIEEQKGRVLRDTAVGYPGAQGEYPPMQGAAIDFLGNEAGTERHIGGAQLLRQKFPNEMVPRQSNARPSAPKFKSQRNWSQGGGYKPY